MDSSEFSQINDCCKNTLWNCGCWKKMKAAADLSWVHKKSHRVNVGASEEGRGRVYGARDKELTSGECVTVGQISLLALRTSDESLWSHQDWCIFSPEQPGICTNVSVSTLCRKTFFVRFQIEALLERDLCFWSRNRSFYVTNGSVGMGIVPMMWSDVKNNNLSQSVAKTITFGGCKLTFRSCPEGF